MASLLEGEAESALLCVCSPHFGLAKPLKLRATRHWRPKGKRARLTKAPNRRRTESATDHVCRWPLAKPPPATIWFGPMVRYRARRRRARSSSRAGRCRSLLAPMNPISPIGKELAMSLCAAQLSALKRPSLATKITIPPLALLLRSLIRLLARPCERTGCRCSKEGASFLQLQDKN